MYKWAYLHTKMTTQDLVFKTIFFNFMAIWSNDIISQHWIKLVLPEMPILCVVNLIIPVSGIGSMVPVFLKLPTATCWSKNIYNVAEKEIQLQL